MARSLDKRPRSSRHLGADEQLVRSMHTHAKVLITPALVFLVLAVALGVGLAMLPSGWPAWSQWVLVGLAAVLFLAGVLVPVLRWRSNSYTLTNRRIIHRQGIVTRTAHDLPLNRINDVASERSLLDRVFGCGSLRLTTAAEDPVVLRDIPDVEQVHLLLSELLFGTPGQGELADTRDDLEPFRG